MLSLYVVYIYWSQEYIVLRYAYHVIWKLIGYLGHMTMQ